MSTAWDAAAVAAVACGVGGLLVPVLIARIPEPEPAPPAEEGAAVEEPKEAYAAIATRPGLRWRSAAVAAAAGGLVGASTGWDWPLLLLLPLVPVAVALGIIDWRTRLLPTRLVAPAYVLAVLLVLACFVITRDTDDLVRAGLGWVVAGGLYFLLWFVHPRGLGYGDVRLSGVLGIALGYLGWGQLMVGVYAGFLLGGFGGVLLTLTRLVERRAMPFGPFMLVGALVGIVAGAGLWANLAAG
jgi:leader peptidase (prepilin peptidase)/N-methyltransferase